MNTLFVKSGSYYETAGVSAAGAIGEIIDHPYTMFVKNDNAFKFDYIDGEYRFYMPNHIPGASPVYRTLSVSDLIASVDKYGYAFYGISTESRALVSPSMVLSEASFISFDQKQKKFVNTLTENPYPGTNVLPLMYCVKMADGAYAAYLSDVAKINSTMSDSETGVTVIGDTTIVCVDDGQSIQSKFIDIKFENAVKHFRNMDLVTGYAVYGFAEEVIEMSIFKDSPIVTDEFRKNLLISSESNFDVEYRPADDTIRIKMPKEKGCGFLSVKIETTPLYEDISSREIRELMSFDFMLFSI